MGPCCCFVFRYLQTILDQRVLTDKYLTNISREKEIIDSKVRWEWICWFSGSGLYNFASRLHVFSVPWPFGDWSLELGHSTTREPKWCPLFWYMVSTLVHLWSPVSHDMKQQVHLSHATSPLQRDHLASPSHRIPALFCKSNCQTSGSLKTQFPLPPNLLYRSLWWALEFRPCVGGVDLQKQGLGGGALGILPSIHIRHTGPLSVGGRSILKTLREKPVIQTSIFPSFFYMSRPNSGPPPPTC